MIEAHARVANQKILEARMTLEQSPARQFIDVNAGSEPRAVIGQTLMDDFSEFATDGLGAVRGSRRNCVDCGSAIPDGAKFCPSCGRAL